MASTYTSLNVHIVFATKNRAPSIDASWRGDFHAYIGGTIRGLGASPIAIGGVADHVHLLICLKATHCVADFVREVKKASSSWASERSVGFGWQTGYGAFTVGAQDVRAVVEYVDRQEEHHRRMSSADELRSLLAEFNIAYEERFFD